MGLTQGKGALVLHRSGAACADLTAAPDELYQPKKKAALTIASVVPGKGSRAQGYEGGKLAAVTMRDQSQQNQQSN